MQDFRSYKKAKIIFSKGLNGIVGKPQSGKTNIIRALKLITFNRPPGLKFVRKRNELQSARIEVKVDACATPVVLSKGKSTFYAIGDQRFEKFKQQVPEKIVEALNLSEINFHEQLASPFLITSKASEVSQAINDVTGINNFDIWIDRVNQKTRELKLEKKIRQKELDAADSELSKLKGLQAVENTVIELKANRKKINALTEKLDQLKEISAVIKDLETRKGRERDILRLRPIIEQMLQIRKAVAELEQKQVLMKEAMASKKRLAQQKMEFKIMGQEFIDILKKIKRCPTCFGPITKQVIGRIRNEVSSSE